MKKALLLLVLFFFMFSCEDNMEFVKPSCVGTDGKVNANISFILPDVLPSSRALSKEPYVDNIYLAVFDAAGYLLEYVKAESTPATTNEIEYSYQVKLSPTTYPTTIHFIGNAPASVSFGTESEVIGRMYTWGGNDAYWQKVYLPEGIKLNDAGTALDAEVMGKLNGIRLVRNFSWIELTLAESVKNFQLESYCVINSRDKGSVAPYNASTGGFAEYGEKITHKKLVDAGYGANIPVDANLEQQILNEMYWCKVGGEATNGYFIYEREVPRTDPLYMIMKGTYDPDLTTEGDEMVGRYYKVDLRDNSGDYFPVLRNFKYSVQLTNISHSGHASAQAAAQGLGSGDVATSIETESFNNISNNIIRLWVDYTDITLISSEPVTLKYKFVLLDSESVQNENVNILLEDVEEDKIVISYLEKDVADGPDGWRTITIMPTELSDIRKTQSITLEGTVSVDGKTYTLKRKVKFTLMKKLDIELICDPDAIANVIGSPFDLILKVPGGLGYSMFPLDFEIEAEQQSITPDKGDNLPVITGTSIVPNKSLTTIGFIKSVSWNEYDKAANESGFKSIRCHFKSNKAASATSIFALNEYFNIAKAELGNYIPNVFTNLAFVPQSIPAQEGSGVVFSFNMSALPAQGNVTVTLDGLEPKTAGEQLIYLGVKDGKAQYAFSPTSKDNNSFDLVTSVNSGVVNVKLEAYRFTPNNAIAAIGGLLIPAGHIQVGLNISSSTIFSLYASNPGKKTNVQPFASFTANSEGANPENIIVLDDVLKEIKNDKIYVRYSTQFLFWTTYYVAEVDLSDLIAGTAGNLTFSQQ